MTSRANPKSLLSSITMVTASVVLKVRFCEATRKPPLHSEPSVYHTNASRASVPRPKNPSTGKSAPGSPRKHLSPPNGPRRSGPSPDQISRPALPESLPKLPVPRGRSFKKPALSRSAACPKGLVHAKESVLPGAGFIPPGNLSVSPPAGPGPAAGKRILPSTPSPPALRQPAAPWA